MRFFILTLVVWFFFLPGCGRGGPEITRVTVRPFEPTMRIEPGEHTLGLGGYRLVNRSMIWRDGLLFVPRAVQFEKPLPLLVWLHGGGGSSGTFRYMYPLADEFGVVLLILDARHNTWDGIDSRFGPDVLFIDKALRDTFDRIRIDPDKIALGGLSDGASYALAIGRVNGDLFTHLIAIAPGGLRPPGPDKGRPLIFVGHGIRDNVYYFMGSRKYIVPGLRKKGYDVTYLEFDGPHWLPAPEGRNVLKWLVNN